MSKWRVVPVCTRVPMRTYPRITLSAVLRIKQKVDGLKKLSARQPTTTAASLHRKTMIARNVHTKPIPNARRSDACRGTQRGLAPRHRRLEVWGGVGGGTWAETPPPPRTTPAASTQRVLAPSPPPPLALTDHYRELSRFILLNRFENKQQSPPPPPHKAKGYAY